MITPTAFANIGYKTYIIFACINAAMVPSVYFFFPETAYRSLEEMDEIFRNTTGVLDVVRVSAEVPHRYDRRGELLIAYEETGTARRRSSAVAPDETKVERQFREGDVEIRESASKVVGLYERVGPVTYICLI
jgi:hypothetical protein